jgi:hypothetical protein
MRLSLLGMGIVFAVLTGRLVSAKDDVSYGPVVTVDVVIAEFTIAGKADPMVGFGASDTPALRRRDILASSLKHACRPSVSMMHRYNSVKRRQSSRAARDEVALYRREAAFRAPLRIPWSAWER